jgi:hypothetical protein
LAGGPFLLTNHFINRIHRSRALALENTALIVKLKI